MYIELFGFPGAGKTTICKKASAEFGGLYKPNIRNKKFRIFLDVKFVIFSICNLRFIILLIYYFRRNLMLKPINTMKFIHTMNMIYYFYDSKSKKNIFFSDHGFIQTFMQNKDIMESMKKNKILLNNVLKLIPPGNYLYLDVPMDISRIQGFKRDKIDKGEDLYCRYSDFLDIINHSKILHITKIKNFEGMRAWIKKN